MRDHKVLFLQIPGGSLPLWDGPVFWNDILKIGIGPIVCGYKHDRFVHWMSLVLGIVVVSRTFQGFKYFHSSRSMEILKICQYWKHRNLKMVVIINSKLIYVSSQKCLYAFMYVCIYECMHTYMLHVCSQTCMMVWMASACKYVCIYVYKQAWLSVCKYVCVCMYVCIQTCIRVYIYIYIYICRHVY